MFYVCFSGLKSRSNLRFLSLVMREMQKKKHQTIINTRRRPRSGADECMEGTRALSLSHVAFWEEGPYGKSRLPD